MGPDLRGGCLEGVDMDHPPPKLWHKAATGLLTFCFGGNCALEPEAFPTASGQAALRRKTEIDMGMPLCGTQRHALVQLVLRQTSRRGIHCPFQLIALVGFRV